MALDISNPAISDALVVLGAAGLVIPAFARLKISPVIGFILVGVLVGPFGLGAFERLYPWLYYVTISDPAAMAPIAEMGIVLLLFSVGLELSFRRLWRMRNRVGGIGAAEVVANAILLGLALWLCGYAPSAAIGLGLALSLSSTALVLPISGTTSAVGKLAFAMLLFEDLALVPMIFLLGALAPGGGDPGALATTLGLGIAAVVAMSIAGRLILPRIFAQAARVRSPEMFLSVSLLVVIVASLATAAVGLSPIVGALVAGLLIAETDYAHEVETVVAPFRGLALGVFLITVGMSLDLGAIAANWPAYLGAVAGVVALKTIVTATLLRIGGVPGSVAAETGLLMASPSETTLIVLGAAAAAGVIAPDTASFWQVVTAMGLTITPLLARIGHDVARRSEWAGRTPDEPATGPERRTVIIGFGRVGRMVADMLDRHERPWVAIEADVDTVTVARRDGRPVRFGDAARRNAVEAMGVDQADAVVLTMNSAVEAVRLTRDLRARFPDLTIVARARDPEHAAELYRAGATDAVPETLESALQLSEALLVDLGVAMGPVITSIHEKRDELRAEIKKGGGLSEAPRLKAL